MQVQKLVLLQKLGGHSPKKIRGPKTCKISVGTAEDIQNRPTLQTMAIPPAFNEKGPMNFGPLTAWNYM